MFDFRVGADELKIEPPAGDMCRSVAPFLGGLSFPVPGLNRGKRSISLDFRTDEGLRSAIALVRTTDMLVENQSSGAMSDDP